MSNEQGAIGAFKKFGLLMVIAFVFPLIASFILWIVGSAFAGAGGLAPGIGYGISQITASTPGASAFTIASGVSYFWINGATNGGIASSPAFPSVLVTILNELLIVVSLLIGFFLSFEFVTSLMGEMGGRNR